MIKRIAILAALLSAPLSAQAAGVHQGDLVRFQRGPRGVHRVVEAGPGTLLVQREKGEPVLVSVNSARVFRAAGHESRLVSAGRGALIGVLVGGAAGGVIGYSTFEDPDYIAARPIDAAAFGAAGFGIIGGGLGAVVGALSPRTRWVRVSPTSLRTAELSPTVRDGGVGASLTIRF